MSDAQLQTWLGDTDLLKDTITLSLQAMHYAIIPVLLADREAGIIHRLQDRQDDPSAWMRLQAQIRAQLKIDLDDAGEMDDATGGSRQRRISIVRLRPRSPRSLTTRRSRTRSRRR